MRASVAIQEQDFDAAALQSALFLGEAGEGAVVAFTGLVRRDNDAREVKTLELEHYPGMTERSISEIVDEAARRWPLIAAGVVHRVGVLRPGEQIVWVGVSSAHREAAFSAVSLLWTT